MLEALGLTTAESAAYEDLVRRGMTPVSELSARWEQAPDDILPGLAAKGLITRHPGPPAQVAPTPPDVALEGLALEREEQLRRARAAMADLTVAYRQGPRGDDPSELVEAVIGLDAVVQRWERLQESARREVRGFDRPPYGAAHNDLELELLGRGIAYRSIYQRESLEDRLPHLELLATAGEQARVVNDVRLKLILVDDRFGLVPLRAVGGPDSAVVVHPSPLLEALSWLFELVWERAVPLNFAADQPEHDGGRGAPLGDERRLLSLLASGITDVAIARHLGWSSRTMYRRLRLLLEHLDANTRFQAGIQASRRGWI